ncbi:hypothetical protein [Polymorphospora rubra]|uniref:Uncharacterized protein n=1 Tax=Polymorphospora rubra TaxID=338584 RepID=A0A810MZW3_9ACTN|nr:hypothetical protein [Polymorphospora rubra]BCJ64885.1 hypothetical protein Prubr_19060 [Polymorphospora rubra]
MIWWAVAASVGIVLAVLLCCAGWIWRFGVPMADQAPVEDVSVVENHLAVELAVEVDRGAGPGIYRVRSGSYTEIPTARDCASSVRLTARDPDGRVLGELNGPFCEVRTWVFEADGSVELLSGRRPFPG